MSRREHINARQDERLPERNARDACARRSRRAAILAKRPSTLQDQTQNQTEINFHRYANIAREQRSRRASILARCRKPDRVKAQPVGSAMKLILTVTLIRKPVFSCNIATAWETALHVGLPIITSVMKTVTNTPYSDAPTIGNSLQPYEFLYPDLIHENNYECTHCGSVLWKEKKLPSYNCCNKGSSGLSCPRKSQHNIQHTIVSKFTEEIQWFI